MSAPNLRTEPRTIIKMSVKAFFIVPPTTELSLELAALRPWLALARTKPHTNTDMPFKAEEVSMLPLEFRKSACEAWRRLEWLETTIGSVM